MVTFGEFIMILELHRQGLKVAAIARQLGVDRKTVRKYISRGLEPPTYGPRPRRQKSTDPFLAYLRERFAAFPGLTAVRLSREIRERGYAGGYTAVKRAVRDIRPDSITPFEVRFETPPGEQAQVDLARFEVEFTDEPGITRIVWLFSMVLGYSRLIWARFVIHQDLQSVLRCHIAALEAIGGVPREILYDRMKTAVIGEDPDGLVIYNRVLLDLARHYGFQPRACRPYRPKMKGKVERPFRYIREDFFLGASFRHLDDLNIQLRRWLDTVANPRVHATTQRVVNEAFTEEKPALKPLPLVPYRTVLKLERRLSHEGRVSVSGNTLSNSYIWNSAAPQYVQAKDGQFPPTQTNITNADPGFASPTPVTTAPDCSTAATVLACVAAIRANFVPSGRAAAFGYQPPGACSPDPLYPAWLKGAIPDGLLTKPCGY